MENGSLSDGLRNLKIFTAPWDHKGLKHIIFLRKRAHVVSINWVYSNSGSFSGINPLMMILHTLAKQRLDYNEPQTTPLLLILTDVWMGRRKTSREERIKRKNGNDVHGKNLWIKIIYVLTSLVSVSGPTIDVYLCSRRPRIVLEYKMSAQST